MMTALRRSALLAALAVAAMPAAAEEIRYATGFPPNSTGDKAAQTFAEALARESGGALTAKVYAASLLSFSELSGGLREGIVETGALIGPYFPTDYPSSNVLGELVMLWADAPLGSRPALAWTGAMTEFIALECDACQAEFLAQNQVFTVNSSTGYSLICSRPVETVSDLAGLKIRAAAPAWSRWAASVGAIGVTVPTSEQFVAMSQGVLDCTISNPVELVDLGLAEVAKAVVSDYPGGGFGTASIHNVGADFWAGLDAAGRTALLKASAAGAAALTWRYEEKGAAAVEAAAGMGVEAGPPSQEMAAQAAAFAHADADAAVAAYAERFGISGAEQSAARMQALFARWLTLVEPVDSEAAFAALLWDEALSRIDVAAYGARP
ncbi:hypothetical protein [uncultured Albimonas sp.]|uniref:hypothetical protein n=1 Tax=uncultured Albimonas sp. TaxID=1331701 RepID=UPI0030EB21B7